MERYLLYMKTFLKLAIVILLLTNCSINLKYKDSFNDKGEKVGYTISKQRGKSTYETYYDLNKKKIGDAKYTNMKINYYIIY